MELQYDWYSLLVSGFFYPITTLEIRVYINLENLNYDLCKYSKRDTEEDWSEAFKKLYIVGSCNTMEIGVFLS